MWEMTFIFLSYSKNSQCENIETNGAPLNRKNNGAMGPKLIDLFVYKKRLFFGRSTSFVVHTHGHMFYCDREELKEPILKFKLFNFESKG